jgi:hypothetical protein
MAVTLLKLHFKNLSQRNALKILIILAPLRLCEKIISFYLDQTGRFLARGRALMKQWNDECRLTNGGIPWDIALRATTPQVALTILGKFKSKEYLTSTFIISCSIFDIHFFEFPH